MRPSWTEITALGLLLGFGAVLAKGWPSGGDLWTALGAIGSLSAAIVALWLGTSETRMRLRAERLEAQLLATSLRVSLVNAARTLRTAHSVLSDLGIDDLAIRLHNKEMIEHLTKDLNRAQELMISAHDQLPADAIHKLIHMPNNAALRLSAVIAEIKSAASSLQSHKNAEACFMVYNKTEGRVLPRIKARCDGARKALLILARECSSYART